MPSHRKRPRKTSPPPLAGGGEQADAKQTLARGRGPVQRSRELRAQSSEAEQKLWCHLRRKKIGALRFRRQFPLGPYFADFVCLPARLVVEVDGSQHAEAGQALHDARRTEWLNRNEFRVLRFWVSEVMTNIEGVIDTIDAATRTPPTKVRSQGSRSFAPSRKGRGEAAP